MAKIGTNGVAGARTWGDRAEYDINRPSAACWVRFSALNAAEQNFFGRGFGTASAGQWCLRATSSNLRIVARLRTSAVGTTTPVTNTWYHVGFRFDNSGNLQLFVNGSQEASTNDGNTNFGAGADTIAATLRSSTQYCAIAECAVWSTPLSDDDFLSLAAGYGPEFVRPDALILYDSMLNVASNTWAATGATDADSGTVNDFDHPSIIYPCGALSVVQGGVVPAADSGPLIGGRLIRSNRIQGKLVV